MTPSTPADTQLEKMNNRDILVQVRLLEATYKQPSTTLESDHRRHLRRDELEKVYLLVRHVALLRNKVAITEHAHEEVAMTRSLVH